MPHIDVGESIPPDTAHAVSVSLPSWHSNVGYEEGEEWVVSRMVTGYPRFFIHKSIQAFAADLAARFAAPGQKGILFPNQRIASRCLAFIRARAPQDVTETLDAVHLVLDTANPASAPLAFLSPSVSAVFCAAEAFPYAKEYWQHTGDGVSSRRAEFCHGLFKEGLLRPGNGSQSPPSSAVDPTRRRGPRRYQRPMSLDGGHPAAPKTNGHAPTPEAGPDAQETSRFLEERFGRNLDVSFVSAAKSAIRRRIAGALTSDLDLTVSPLPAMGANSRGVADLKEEDVYLYPCGMSAISNVHRALLAARGDMKSINFGFPYVDTLKTLEKFGPGCVFYGRASETELDELENRLRDGDRFLGLFCEFPGNPLLTCPNLARIRSLADAYDFAVVVDETVGTFANVDVMQFADVVVCSLTKIFSGDCNVMGGSAIINPGSRYYSILKNATEQEFDDVYWPEDVIFMERNSRHFASRIGRVNTNAEAICEVLASHPLVKKVYYPTYNESRPNYEACKLPKGGYGGLISVTFHAKPHAVAFFDAIETAKGPSLGTNFTLISPFVLLAHYQELDWAASLGVDPDLLRISVGLEETEQIINVFRAALQAAEGVTL